MEKYTRPPAQFTPMSPHRSAVQGTTAEIEEWLREDGHRAWGFVIYRSTYQNQAAWDEFMRRLLANTTEMLEYDAGLDLLDNLALTVFDNPNQFDNATTAMVRDHFKQWAATMEEGEQGPISIP